MLRRTMFVVAMLMLMMCLNLQRAMGSDFDGPDGVRNFMTDIDLNIVMGSLEVMDQKFSAYMAKSLRLEDGRWVIGIYPIAFESYFARNRKWNELQGKIREWRRKIPNSFLIVIAEAQYWISYAWDARGGGSAASVTPEGWKLFKERLSNAENILLSSKERFGNNPLWYQLYIEVAIGLDWSLERVSGLFEEAMSKNKYFYQNYFGMIRYLSPKWHGSYEQIDQFIRRSVEVTADVEGATLYARLYWYLDQEEGIKLNIFEQSHASWVLMKKGFEDMMQRYPKSIWNLNNFASFACRAGDKNTYLELRQRIGSMVIQSAWRSNYSLDLCDYKFKIRI